MLEDKVETVILGEGCIKPTNRKLTPNGNLRMFHEGRVISYNKYLWTKVNGEIDKEYHVRLKCGNPWCLNVDHMELVRSSQYPVIDGHKECVICHEVKPESEYTQRKPGVKQGACRSCCAIRVKKSQSTKPFHYICRRTKSRCKDRGIPYSLTPEYLESIWVDKCPVLGTHIRVLPAEVNGKVIEGELDKFIPSLGYVKGNVHFISTKANRMKSDGSIQDVEALLSWMKQQEET